MPLTAPLALSVGGEQLLAGHSFSTSNTRALLQLLSETDLNLQHVLFVLFLLWGRKKAGSRIILTLPQKAFKKNHWGLLEDQREERRWNHVQLVCPEEVRVQLQEKGEEKETTSSSSPTSTQRMGCEKYSVTQAIAGRGENSCHPILERWGHCCPQLSKALMPRGRGELCWRALLAPHFSPLLMTKKTTQHSWGKGWHLGIKVIVESRFRSSQAHCSLKRERMWSWPWNMRHGGRNRIKFVSS